VLRCALHEKTVICMFGNAWTLISESVSAFVDDEALTRGAAIAFYTVTSIGPVLLLWSPLPALFSVKMQPEGRSPISLAV